MYKRKPINYSGKCSEPKQMVGELFSATFQLRTYFMSFDKKNICRVTGSMETEYQLDRANVKIGSLHRGTITICSANTRLG